MKRRTPLRAKRRSGRARPTEPLATWCEVQLPGCTGRATDRHHIAGRVGADADSPDNTLDVCSHCHLVGIHGNPARAYQLGYLRKRT